MKKWTFLCVAVFSAIAFFIFPLYFFTIGWGWPAFDGNRMWMLFLGRLTIPFILALAVKKIFRPSDGMAIVFCLLFFSVIFAQSRILPDTLCFALGFRARLMPFAAEISDSAKKADLNKSLKESVSKFLALDRDEEFSFSVNPVFLAPDGGRVFTWENENFIFRVIISDGSNIKEERSSRPLLLAADGIYVFVEQRRR